MPRLQPLRLAPLGGVEVLFSDVDGTLTTQGRLRAATLRALELLVDDGLEVVLVTGRPAGWAEAFARTLPVRGVIAENGALYFARAGAGAGLVKRYVQPPRVRRADRRRLLAEVRRVLARVPGARLSMDSQYTEVDLAIDYNESVHLGSRAAAALEAGLHARGVRAVRSSVHVNCWLGRFDKLSTVDRFIERELKAARRDRPLAYAYVGDSLNDAPMFEGFALSVGVANVADVLDALEAPPAFVTRAREGEGFAELARALRAARKRGEMTR